MTFSFNPHAFFLGLSRLGFRHGLMCVTTDWLTAFDIVITLASSCSVVPYPLQKDCWENGRESTLTVAGTLENPDINTYDNVKGNQPHNFYGKIFHKRGTRQVQVLLFSRSDINRPLGNHVGDRDRLWKWHIQDWNGGKGWNRHHPQWKLQPKKSYPGETRKYLILS